MKSLARIASLLVLFVVPHVAVGATETWRGRAGNAAHGMSIDLTISSGTGAQSGFVTLQELAARGIPLRSVTRTGDRLVFELEIEKSVMTFTGTISARTASGTYAMGPMRGSFELALAKAETLPYRQRAVRFDSGNISLAGTLLLPARTGRVPGAVFLHGSGKVTRDGNRFIADQLARRGVASLIFDKRGSGESGGDLKTSNFYDLAADAVAAVRFLRAQPEVDAKSVGFVGASQAGWIGTMAATTLENVRFMAWTSAPVVTVSRESWWDYEVRLRDRGFSAADVAEAQKILVLDDEVTRSGTRFDELQRLVEAARTKAWFAAMEFELVAADHPSRAAFRRIMDIDPEPLLRNLDTPVLWLFGGRDTTVPVDWSLDALLPLVRAGKDYKLRVFRDANHAMIVMPPDMSSGGWPRRVPEHAPLVVGWILEQLAPRR